jgi:hypothetical protein
VGEPVLRPLAQLEVRHRPGGGPHDKVRVARSLESLPEISAAFRSGQVSYSKVRAPLRGQA